MGYPRVVEAGVDEGYEWLLTEEVRGASLRETWPALRWDERERALVELWHMARAVHTAKEPELDPHANCPFYAPTPEAAEAQVAALETQGVLAAGECASLRAALASFWAAVPASPSVLCHGDLTVGNALWQDGHVVCLLDFEFAVAAPVELDAHHLLRDVDDMHDNRDRADPQADRTGDAQRRLMEAVGREMRTALSEPGAPERLRGYAVLYQLWSMLGWLKHWDGKEDYTAWRPFRLLTALAAGDNVYLAPLLPEG